MASLKKLRQAKVPLAVPVIAGYDDQSGEPITEEIRVVYYAHVFDGAYEKEVNKFFQERVQGIDANVFDISAFKFCHVVASWDLKADEDDADPIPLTVEGLAESGVTRDLLEDILAKIVADRRPKETTATT